VAIFSVPALKLTSAELWFRLIAAFVLLAGGGLLILEAVVLAASGNFFKGCLLLFPGFALLTASVWLMRTSYDRLQH
jgi:hypothetical protein